MPDAGLDGVINNLNAWGRRKEAAVIALAQNWAGTLEGRAKQNARWTDRTGNARNGLKGQAIVGRREVAITLSHSMDYGVWLELANSGRNAILGPTMDAALPEIRDSYRTLMEGL